MTAVTTWTGWEANALRKALRMSVSEFAEHIGAARRTVAKWSSRGRDIQLRHDMQAALDTMLARAAVEVRERFAALVDTCPDGAPASTAAVTVPPPVAQHDDTGLVDTSDLIADGDVRRRELFPLAAVTASAVVADGAVAAVLDVLLSGSADPSTQALSLVGLETAVAAVKTDYQACRYDQVLDRLAVLLPAMTGFESIGAGAELARMRILATDAYHVVGSVLLKLDDPAMALVAAQHSARYARMSDDPVAAGTAARIVTHALMGNGHAVRAVGHAVRAAEVLEERTGLGSDEAVAVHGALVLRGAIAAARADDRDGAQSLLDEASRSAARLGHDGNARWTGFGPTNVLLHRVNVALACGDAGSAIALARRVPLDKITLAERRASLFVDVATAYAQWGRYEQALAALRTADGIAPQEVRSRSTVRRVVSDLAVLAHGSVRSQVHAFATATGIRV